MKIEWEKYKPLFDKYKYLLLVILAGTVLLLWPQGSGSGEKEAPPANAQAPPVSYSVEDMEVRLENALSRMAGVGRVKVVLTLKNNGETVYQTDGQLKQSQEQSSENTSRISQETSDKTLVVNNGSGVQQPAVVKQGTPEYLGACVICDGGDDASITLNVVNAVASLTGLKSTEITVVRMTE